MAIISKFPTSVAGMGIVYVRSHPSSRKRLSYDQVNKIYNDYIRPTAPSKFSMMDWAFTGAGIYAATGKEFLKRTCAYVGIASLVWNVVNGLAGYYNTQFDNVWKTAIKHAKNKGYVYLQVKEYKVDASTQGRRSEFQMEFTS